MNMRTNAARRLLWCVTMPPLLAGGAAIAAWVWSKLGTNGAVLLPAFVVAVGLGMHLAFGTLHRRPQQRRAYPEGPAVRP